jgi:hypothetical protein
MKTFRNILIAVFVALQAFSLFGDDSYNCHNYAWESSRRWLDDPTPYIEAAEEVAPEVANRIVYFKDGKPIHSGVYLGNGFVKSKWGSNPIVVHPTYVSTYGFDVRFYRCGSQS